jgi:formamidopyrimidine-DNA glycosylase
MPELPEVETIRRQLAVLVEGGRLVTLVKTPDAAANSARQASAT